MTRSRLLLATAAGLLAAGSLTAQAGEVFVFTGAANLPGWETRYEIANGRGDPESVVLHIDSRTPGPCPEQGCGEREVNLPANATVSSDPYSSGVTTVFALLSSGPISMRARTFPTDGSIELSFDIPSIRLSTLDAANPSELIFPVRQDAGGRSNLALASVHGPPPAPLGGEAISVRIEAFSADGTLSATTEANVPDGSTIYLVRLLDSLHLPDFDGQIRVTKLGGSGLLWGVMYQINADGQTSSTPGFIP